VKNGNNPKETKQEQDYSEIGTLNALAMQIQLKDTAQVTISSINTGMYLYNFRLQLICDL
jgi:hypothetical protein